MDNAFRNFGSFLYPSVETHILEPGNDGGGLKAAGKALWATDFEVIPCDNAAGNGYRQPCKDVRHALTVLGMST